MSLAVVLKATVLIWEQRWCKFIIYSSVNSKCFQFLDFTLPFESMLCCEKSVSSANCPGFPKCTSDLGRNFPCKYVPCLCADSASSAKLHKCPSFSKIFY